MSKEQLEKEIRDNYDDMVDAGNCMLRRDIACNKYWKLQEEYLKEFGHKLEVVLNG